MINAELFYPYILCFTGQCDKEIVTISTLVRSIYVRKFNKKVVSFTLKFSVNAIQTNINNGGTIRRILN